MYSYPHYEEGSFCLGMTYAFCEMVCRDLKRIALSNPMEPALYAQLREDYNRIADKFEVKSFVEEALVSTLLAPDEECHGKVIVLFYKRDADLTAYLALRERVRALQLAGGYDDAQKKQATIEFCRLLSYSEEQVDAVAGA